MEKTHEERNKQFSQLLGEYETLMETLKKKDEQMR